MMHEYTSNGRRSRGVSDSWLWAGKEMVASLNRTSVKCGYASVSDVGTGKLLDSMVSIQSEGAAREWSTVVKISILPLSFKPVSLFLSRSPLL